MLGAVSLVFVIVFVSANTLFAAVTPSVTANDLGTGLGSMELEEGVTSVVLEEGVTSTVLKEGSTSEKRDEAGVIGNLSGNCNVPRGPQVPSGCGICQWRSSTCA